jgi:hypothetical protein
MRQRLPYQFPFQNRLSTALITNPMTSTSVRSRQFISLSFRFTYRMHTLLKWYVPVKPSFTTPSKHIYVTRARVP